MTCGPAAVPRPRSSTTAAGEAGRSWERRRIQAGWLRWPVARISEIGPARSRQPRVSPQDHRHHVRGGSGLIGAPGCRWIQLVVATVLDVGGRCGRGGWPSAAPRDMRVRFWQGVRAGLGRWDAGKAAGLRLARRSGGSRRRAGSWRWPGAGPGRYLLLAEREEIAVGLAARRAAAADRGAAGAAGLDGEPGGAPGTVRARVLPGDGGAVPGGARARRPKTAKLAGNEELRGWVQGKLEEKVVAGADQPAPGGGVPAPSGDAGAARDDLPVHLRAGPGGAAAGAGDAACGPGGRCASPAARRASGAGRSRGW